MNVLDLFSGIGGFSLGLEAAGMQTVAFCEIESYCQKILRRHWPDVPIFEDVRRIDGRELKGTVELICGGYPCQPFSMAGQRRGTEDERHLWPEMYRLKPPPSCKRTILEKYVFPKYGTNPESYVAIESNPSTRSMYDSFGIVALTADTVLETFEPKD